ncbi:4'-phosphopantetheinyl transferase superfamily protein [Pseudomonas sp. CAN2814]|uniref:4'-phosphopantetheinyl transferase family protein n=1 Tax=Pseudomonas sp. CAN1 TaxID=3046726 RepID=UPI002648B200|nr:4'-phosphopantetheinyl transferase superfamily protein [Pseudomonas sp. CAN1]MDN6857355.1 4'-phosphopantetheinyl transferase superfamily protein [Pseudomonas sp. CAN1]
MTTLPAFCTPLDADWPLPTPLAGCQLRSTRFDRQRLQAGDFALGQVEPPANIQRSVAKRQAEYLAGRLCAREALLAAGGPAQVPGTDEERAPVWPAGFCGSITHGDGWAAAIVAHNSEWRSLGLDVENRLETARAERLAAEILTPDELARLDPQQAALQVTLTFSLKESLFKALFPLVRKRFYFEHAELLSWSAGGHVQLRLLTDLSEEWHHGKEVAGQFSLFDGRLLSLVAIPAI